LLFTWTVVVTLLFAVFGSTGEDADGVAVTVYSSDWSVTGATDQRQSASPFGAAVALVVICV
jgi:hypothetical protein